MKLIKTDSASSVGISYRSDIEEKFKYLRDTRFDVIPSMFKASDSPNKKAEEDLINIKWRYNFYHDNDWVYGIQLITEYLITEKDKQIDDDNILLEIERSFENMCKELNKQKEHSPIVASFTTPTKDAIVDEKSISLLQSCRVDLNKYLTLQQT